MKLILQAYSIDTSREHKWTTATLHNGNSKLVMNGSLMIETIIIFIHIIKLVNGNQCDINR